MAMVQIGDVGMFVRQRRVVMDVRVRLPRRRVGRMVVLMVLVMNVLVFMPQRIVDMKVLVPVAGEQPHASDHEPEGEPVPPAQALSE